MNKLKEFLNFKWSIIMMVVIALITESSSSMVGEIPKCSEDAYTFYTIFYAWGIIMSVMLVGLMAGKELFGDE